jgi:hypothetical protein
MIRANFLVFLLLCGQEHPPLETEGHLSSLKKTKRLLENWKWYWWQPFKENQTEKNVCNEHLKVLSGQNRSAMYHWIGLC